MAGAPARDRRMNPLRLALWAQRRARLVPGPLRSAVGRGLQWLGVHRLTPDGPPHDWSVPLVAGRGSADIEALRPSAVASPGPPARPATVTEVLRCVIATNVLDVGGAEEVAAFLARRLPELGIGTTVVYADVRLAGQADAGGRLARSLAEAGVPTVALSPSTAKDWFASNRIDVVSSHYAPDWLLDAAVANDVPWVETLHGMHVFLDPAAWPAERRRATRIAAQIAVSELVRQQYLRGNPDYPAHRIVAITNGIESARRVHVDRDQARAALGLADEFLFFSPARYCLQKNTFALVSAFGEVARTRPDVHLLCAGRAADDLLYFEQTRGLLSSLPGADRIHLRGHCANVTALYAAADAFVLNSFFEGAELSLAGMEALIIGLPMIMSDVGGGARELLGPDGVPGHLIGNPAGDPELVDWNRISRLRFRAQPNRHELIAAMESMADRRDHWRGERDRLRAAGERLFSPETSLRGHAEVLSRVARREETLN